MQGNPTPNWTNIGSIPTLLSNLGSLETTGLIEHIGSGTVATNPITAFAKTLIDDSTASAAQTTLGATTVGSNLFTLSNPGAVTFLRVNVDNSVSTRNAADFRADIGAGTVSSVQASGGSTGLTFTGGPITGSGTLTIGGTLAVAFGGTGATTAVNARTNLGLGSLALQNANAVDITGGIITSITDLAINDGGTGASTASGARTNLGLGTIATQNSNAISITGGDISGLTSITVPTATVGTNTTAAASTAFVQLEVNSTAFAEWGLNNYNLSMTTGVILTPTLISPTVYAGSGFGTGGYTVPTGQGGLYYVEIYGEINGSANNISYATISLKKNSTDFFRRQQLNFTADSFFAFTQTLSTMILLTDGDVVRPQFTAAFSSGTATLQNASFLVHKMNSY